MPMDKGQYSQPSHLFGIRLEKFGFTLGEVLGEISNSILERKAHFVITINLHALSLMKKNKQLRRIYQDADRVVFDGISVISLARLSGVRTVERIGSDWLMKALYKEAQQKGWSFYLLGGPIGAPESAAKHIKEQFPDLRIVGAHHGYFNSNSDEESKIIQEINDLSPDILAVGLGMPKEQKWIHRNKEQLNVGVITNCGAYIEQTANEGVDYYPDWAYRFRLNWLYRVLKEPRRLWKRYLFEGIAFMPLLCQAIYRWLVMQGTRLRTKNQ